MVRDEDTNVSIWMKENIRVKEGAKNKRWHGKWDVEKKRKGRRVRARERENDRPAIYSSISSGKKFLHTKGLTFKK